MLALGIAFAADALAMLDVDKLTALPQSTVLYDRNCQAAAVLSGAEDRQAVALEQVPLGLDGPGRLALEELGEVLGRYDGDGQREALAHTRAELSRALEQAREAREKQGRMYQVLGITAGAFLVILLL